jgi:hypothetical protein
MCIKHAHTAAKKLQHIRMTQDIKKTPNTRRGCKTPRPRPLKQRTHARFNKLSSWQLHIFKISCMSDLYEEILQVEMVTFQQVGSVNTNVNFKKISTLLAYIIVYCKVSEKWSSPE